MNKYEVLGVVGEGAYGVVLRCKNKDTNEIVAIKKFKESEEDEIVRKTTLREVKILRIMRHENIVQLKEAFRRKGKLYLVFEFLEKSMLDVLESHPNGLDGGSVRVVTFQLARALEYCHRHDVIHRDIKPENLLINPNDYALRLCDFGFARTMASDSPLTDYVATRWYRAPELLLGSTAYGKDIDIWAVGCIMGELTDGQPLFAGESEVDQLFVIQKVLGPLAPEQMEMFLRNPRFSGIQFPDVTRPTTIEKRYGRRMPKQQMQVLKGTLAMDSRRRLTAKDMLSRPWFEGAKLPRSLRPPSHSQSRARPESSSSLAAGQQAASSSVSAPVPARIVEAASAVACNDLQEEVRPHREDPRQHREEPRLHREELRSQREDRGDTRPPREPKLQREDLRTHREDTGIADVRTSREDLRTQRDELRSERDEFWLQRDQRACLQLAAQTPNCINRSNPYVLPWEDMQHEGTVPEYTNGPGPYGEQDDRRSTSKHRRSVADTMDAMGGTGDGGMPCNSAGNHMSFGAPMAGNSYANANTSNKLGRSATAGVAAGNSTPGGSPMGASITASANGMNIGVSAGGGANAATTPGHGAPGNATMRHGVSAGTGGSEEWPVTQNRASRSLQPEYDDDKTQWAHSIAKSRQRNLGTVPAQVRRPPEAVDQDLRTEAWRFDAMDMHGGLPSIHGGVLTTGPQGFGPGDSSRVPSRLGAGTPTVGDEDAKDSFDSGPRQLHGGARWNAGDSHAFGQNPALAAELGPLRGHHGALHGAPHETRGALNDGRMTPQHDARVGFGSTGRVYNGH